MCCTRAIDLLGAPRIPHENHAIVHETNPHGVYRSAFVNASISCEASFPPHTLSKQISVCPTYAAWWHILAQDARKGRTRSCDGP